MKPDEFLQRVNKSLKKGELDHNLLTHENKFMRSKYLFKMIENMSMILKLFDFKDTISFKDNIAYIKLNNIKFKLNNTFFLKSSGSKFISPSLNTINFIKYIKLNPKIIIDIGACWGEYSLNFAREFPNSYIYSIEGSPINYSTFQENLKINKKIRKKINPFNLIITGFDGLEEISNNLNTMNTIRNLNNGQQNFVKVQSKKLETFINDQNLNNVDFLKIDIEGAELNLIESLKNKVIKVMQIELINHNNLKENLNFINSLSKYYIFYDCMSFKRLSLNETQSLITETLSKSTTIDLFFLNKSCKNLIPNKL